MRARHHLVGTGPGSQGFPPFAHCWLCAPRYLVRHYCRLRWRNRGKCAQLLRQDTRMDFRDARRTQGTVALPSQRSTGPFSPAPSLYSSISLPSAFSTSVAVLCLGSAGHQSNYWSTVTGCRAPASQSRRPSSHPACTTSSVTRMTGRSLRTCHVALHGWRLRGLGVGCAALRRLLCFG